MFGVIRILAALLVALTASGVCWSEPVELDKIVVTASRIEESSGSVCRKVNVITSKDIEDSGAKALSEILSEISSLNLSDYGSLGASRTIRMRGSTASQILIMVDGKPINSPRDGEVDLSTLPLENIERIEIVHGPVSSLYGSGAMGGVINIITKSPPEKGQETEIVTKFGTSRTYLEQLFHGARIGGLGYNLSLGYQNSEGHRVNSKFDAKDAGLKLEYEVNHENKLSLNTGFFKSTLGAPGPDGHPYILTDVDDKQEWFKNFLDFNWKFKPLPKLAVSAKIYQNYDRLEFIENTAGSVWDTPFKKDTHKTKTRGLDLQFNQQLLDNYLWVYGFNYVKNINDSTATGKHDYLVRAGYFENQISVLENLKINFGARLDDYSNFGTEVCPNFSFLYKFAQAAQIHGLISRSFRAPTFNDLYWPFDGWTEGNPNLKPEKGITGELGITKRLFEFLKADITYFRSDYDDLIKWNLDPDWVYRPRNVSSATIDGIESTNKIILTENLGLDLGYAYIRAKDDKTHKYLTYQPKHKFNFSLNYKGLNGLALSFKGQFVDRSFLDEDNTTYVKRYFILGIYVSKKINDNLTFFASADNLLNKKYQTIKYYPLPGFSITTGLKLRF